MSNLSMALSDYLTVRRVLGFKLRDVGHSLEQFVRFAEAEGIGFITTELALRWATQPLQVSPAHWTRRLGMVRQFAYYCSALDPRTEIPPPDLLPDRYTRKLPYLLSFEDITRLIHAAQQLPSPKGLRAATYAPCLAGSRSRGCRLANRLCSIAPMWILSVAA